MYGTQYIVYLSSVSLTKKHPLGCFLLKPIKLLQMLGAREFVSEPYLSYGERTNLNRNNADGVILLCFTFVFLLFGEKRYVY